MHRAFHSWSSNHRLISFVEVTEECRVLHGHVSNNTCELAEVWITAREFDPDAQGDSVAALATPNPTVAYDFRYTSGLVAAGTGVVETTGGTIAFTYRTSSSGGICWYLDSAFCNNFHALKRLTSPRHVRMVGLTLVLVVTLGAVLWTGLQVLVAFRAFAKKTDARSRCSALLTRLAGWSLWCTALRFVLIVTPWLFYHEIFLPCWDCFDFEAAATHEVGHLLGLSHPDQAGSSRASTCASSPGACSAGVGQNLKRVAAPTACNRSFTGVVPVGDGEEIAPSIMISFTQHNPTVCLSADDLDALHTIYPDCERPAAAGDVVCFKAQHNIGWVRLGVYILIPALCAMAAALVLGAFVQRNQLRRFFSLDLRRRHASLALKESGDNLRRTRQREQAAVRAAESAKAAAHEAVRQLDAVQEVSLEMHLRAEAELQREREEQCGSSSSTAPPPRAAARATERRSSNNRLVSFGRVSSNDRSSELERRSSLSRGYLSTVRATLTSFRRTASVFRRTRSGPSPDERGQASSPISSLVEMVGARSSASPSSTGTSCRLSECDPIDEVARPAEAASADEGRSDQPMASAQASSTDADVGRWSVRSTETEAEGEYAADDSVMAASNLAARRASLGAPSMETNRL